MGSIPAAEDGGGAGGGGEEEEEGETVTVSRIVSAQKSLNE